MGFTELEINRIKEVETKFKKLCRFYDPYMGNFSFTENELFKNMNEILMWLESHEDYALIYQYMADYEGSYWFLTPQSTL